MICSRVVNSDSIIWPCSICCGADPESHEDAITTEITEELQPAKVPILTKDIVNSKKAHALRKEQKRKLGKQRSLGSSMDYSPLPIDKHEPEFVSIQYRLGAGFFNLLCIFCHKTIKLIPTEKYLPIYLSIYQCRAPSHDCLVGIWT